MVCYPDVLKKVQEELDAVIGRNRLPKLEDRPRLPYADAVLKETLRWNSVVPMGVSTQLLQLIPKTLAVARRAISLFLKVT